VLPANVLSGAAVANDRDRTDVVVVIEGAILHGEERAIQKDVVAGHRDEIREVRGKFKDPRGLTVVLVAKLDLHWQRHHLRGRATDFRFQQRCCLAALHGEFGDKAGVFDPEFCYLDFQEGRFYRAENLCASIDHKSSAQSRL
jgi:hypothetical protein